MSLPPGTLAALHFASQVQIGHQNSLHAAIQATTGHYRNAAVLELADRLVGVISECLLEQLGIQSATHEVLISARSQRHAIERRAITSQKNAELVASRISEAFLDIRYLKLPQRKQTVFALVGYVASTGNWLVLPLKWVGSTVSSTGKDELWISTAYPIGKKNLSKDLRKGLLRDLRDTSRSMAI